MRLLIVEDNEELADLLAKGLRAAGFDIDVLYRLGDAREALASISYEALILDLGLPDGDGLSIIQDLRNRSSFLPVLVLTARGGVQDRVAGLRMGADDYLVKPFAFDELVARVEALLRRPGQMLGHSLQFANIVLDIKSRQVFIGERPHVLSAREVAVLELLMRRKGAVVSKKTLEDQIFGLDGEIASNAVEVYVHRLRKQLMDAGANVKVLTMRGIGYVLAEDQQHAPL